MEEQNNQDVSRYELLKFLETQPDNIKKEDLLNYLHAEPQTNEEVIVMPAGWYDDGQTLNRGKRYWDGSAWTDEFEIQSVKDYVLVPAPASYEEAVHNKAINNPVLARQQKIKNEDQNINIMLYVASFLIVGAATLFIGSTGTPEMKFVFAWALSALFYVTGFHLYRHIKKLKPAGDTFIKTGLAIIPIAGVVTNAYIIHDPVISWLITSLVGVLAYAYATHELRNTFITYSVIFWKYAFIISLCVALNVSSTLLAIIIILTSATLSYLSFTKNKLIPDYFFDPMDKVALLVVPLTMFCSIGLGSLNLGLVLGSGSIYYFMVGFLPAEPKNQRLYFFTARSVLSFSLLTLTYAAFESWPTVGIALVIIATIQVALSSYLEKLEPSKFQKAWLLIGLASQLIAIPFWVDNPNYAIATTITLIITMLTSGAITYYLKQYNYLVITLVVSISLVLQIFLDLINPTLTYSTIAFIFAGLSTIFLALRWDLKTKITEKTNTHILAYVSYGIMSLIMIALSSDYFVIATGLLWLTVITLLASYVEKQPDVFTLAVCLFVPSIYFFISTENIVNEINFIITAFIASIIFYAARLLFTTEKYLDNNRGLIFLGSTLLLLFGIGSVFIFRNEIYLSNFAALSLIIGSIILFFDHGFGKEHFIKEASIIITTLATQRLFFNYASMNFLFYAYWWAIVAIGLAYWRNIIKDKTSSNNWLGIGLALITIPTAILALGLTSGSIMFGNTDTIIHVLTSTDHVQYQFLFLIESVLILLVGVILKHKLVTYWGAAGVILSILYWLHSYTYLLIGIAGVSLVSFAIWKLLDRDEPIDEKVLTEEKTTNKPVE